MPAIWIISFVTFCNYVFTLSLYYFTPYATSILGATVTFGATLAAMKRWFSLFGNVGGGFFSDKFGTGNALLISFVVIALGTALFVLIYIFYNVNYAQTWAMMDEGAVPEKYSGSADWIISTIGYLREIFVSVLAGMMIDQNPGVGGYRLFFNKSIAMLVLGAVFVLVWKSYLKKHPKVN